MVVLASMRVHLVRHGEPACPPQAFLTRGEYRRWVGAYDAAGILGQPTVAIQGWLRFSDVSTVFPSTLPRSIRSAEMLLASEEVHTEPLFNEAAVSLPPLPFCLSSTSWTTIGRFRGCSEPQRRRISRRAKFVPAPPTACWYSQQPTAKPCCSDMAG